MKKLIVLFLLVSFGLTVYSQSRTQVSKFHRDVVKTREHKPVKDEVPPFYNQINPTVANPEFVPVETDLMISKFDLYTNSMVSNRFTQFDDGTMAAVTTRGVIPDGSWPDRGTGYNYFNGTNWGPLPSQRIESARTGWPSIAQWGESGEIVIAHLNSGMRICTRPVKGTGLWDEHTIFGPPEAPDLSWPRIVSAGENHNTVHMFSNSYEAYAGQPTALLYGKTTDGGFTWDPPHIILEGMGIDYYTEISADDYAMAARGNTVVLLVTGPFHDMFLMKSEDNGDNWEKILIWEHPYPMWDWNTSLTTDTLYTQDNSAFVALDKYGKAHVVFGISRVMHEAAGTTYNFFPGTDGIGYWNEYMGQIPEHPDNPHKTMDPAYLEELGMLIGWTQDVNNNGTIDFLDDIYSYRQLGISTMPTIVIDDNDVIYVAFSSTTESYNNTIYNLKHIWVRTSPDLGTTWGDFTEITSDINHIFDEIIHPHFADGTQPNHVSLYFNIDYDPGLGYDGDHDPVDNRIVCSKVTKGEIVSVEETQVMGPPVVTGCYPNPASSETSVKLNLIQSAHASVEVYNVNGQLVKEINPVWYTRGVHELTIDLKGFNPGIYLTKTIIGNETYSSKLLVE